MSENINVRRLARRLAALERRLNGAVSTPQLSLSSIHDGTIDEYDGEGKLVGRIGRQPDGSHGYVALDGPTPPTPTEPMVSGGPGTLIARWTGGFLDAEEPTADHRHVEVHVSDDPDFEPDLDRASATRHAVIESPAGGEVTIAKPAGTYFVRLVTATNAGKYSEPSTPGTADVEPLVSEEDFAELEARLEAAAEAIESLRDTDLPALQQRLADTEDALSTLTETDLPALAARLADAEEAVSSTLPSAIEAAQAAADMALLIAPVSTEAPTTQDGEGRPVNAIWTRIDANGNEIGYWRWTGQEWTSQELSPTVIPNLSAGKITSGTLDTNRLNASEVAAAVANVISLNAQRITSGTLDTARLNAQEIAAAVATIIELNADRITSGTISTARLDAEAVAAAVGSFLELNADQITSGTISTARLDAQAVAAAVGSFLSLNASQITSGTIDTARLNATELAAAIADFVTVKAENIQAGTVTADITLEGRLQTSATGQRVVVDDDAITQYDDDNEVIFSTAGGNVFAQGEFRSLDDSGLGVVVGAIEDLGAGSSRAGVEFPTNVPGTDTIPVVYVSRQLSGNPNLNDQALIIRGAHYTGESITNVPTITLHSHSLAQKANGNKNTVDIRAEQVGTNGDLWVHGQASVGSLLVGGDDPFEDSGWIEVTPQNGYSGGGVYRRKVGKQVIINIGCTVGTASSGATLFTLPVGWRPAFATSAAAVSNYQAGTPVQVIVQTTGAVDIYWPSGPGTNSRIRSNVTFFV